MTAIIVGWLCFCVGFIAGGFWASRNASRSVTVLHIHRPQPSDHPLHPEWN